MALFINEQLTTLQDLITKLDAFITANGWTQDQADTTNKKFAWHRGSNYISVRWSTTSPTAFGIYHALGYTGGNDPGNHPNDSGNGAISGTDATILTARHVPCTNTPVQYWAFMDSSNDFVHVVVQRNATPEYVHFGWGKIDKIGDWTGGEYCYGFMHATAGSSDVAMSPNTTVLLDQLLSSTGGTVTNPQLFAATLHAEGLPSQPGAGSGKWLVSLRSDHPSGSLGNDRGGTARGHLLGGFRAGFTAVPFGRFSGVSDKGLMPMYALVPSYFERTSGDIRILGFVPNVRGASIEFFAPGDSVTIGSDTWLIFPVFRKWLSGGLTATSAYQGIAYKKVP